MSVIKGEERILHIKRSGGSFVPVAHLTLNSKNSETTFIDTTVRTNNGFKTEVPIEISQTIEFSAIMFEYADITGKIG